MVLILFLHLKSMKRFTARLRNLRWNIYHAEETKSNVKSILDTYKILVGEFLEKFKMRLKAHEVGVWIEKLSQTIVYANSPQKIEAQPLSMAKSRANEENKRAKAEVARVEKKKKMDDASCPCTKKTNFPRKCNVQRKSNAKVNTIWFGSKKNVLHSNSMEKDVKTKPEGFAKKVDDANPPQKSNVEEKRYA